MVSMTSFEIIPPPESPTENQGILSPGVRETSTSSEAYENGTQTSINSLLLLSFDSRAEEMQKQVDDLIQENNLLKDKVKKSNIVMLEQLNTISSFGKEIKEYKMKQNSLLEEKQNSIDSLKKEKEDLLKKIDQLEESVKVNEKTLSEETQAHVEVLVKEQTLNKELIKQKEELEGIIQSLNEELNKVCDKFKALETENNDLREISNSLYNDISQMEKNHAIPQKTKERPFATVFNDDESGYAIVFKEEQSDISTQGTMQELSELTAKYIQLKADFDGEKMKCGDLEKKLEEKSKQIGSLAEKRTKKKRHNRSEHANSEDQEHFLKELMDKANLTEYYQSRAENLEKELDDVKAALELEKAESVAITAQLEAVNESLKREEYSSELHRKSLSETEKNLKELSEMHQRAMVLLNAQEEREMMKSEQMSTLKDISERYHLEKLDVLTAKLLNMEELLSIETNKNEALQKELDLLKQMHGETSVLKTEVAQTECKKLAEEHQKLKKPKVDSHKSYWMPTKNHSKHHYQHKSRRDRNGTNSTDPVNNSSEDAEETHDKVKLECPHCKMVFHDIDSLESHINLCMNDDIFCV